MYTFFFVGWITVTVPARGPAHRKPHLGVIEKNVSSENACKHMNFML